VAGDEQLHGEVSLRLARVQQRYTASRRAIVEALVAAGRPLTVPEILTAKTAVPMSSAYRNVTVLTEAGALRRVAGADDHGRVELAEDLAGHHHHFMCNACGAVLDVHVTPKLERALAEAAKAVADLEGVEVTDHQLDLVGRCAACR
jgi:Fe2+ or Zn2+ uptake regulation protein